MYQRFSYFCTMIFTMRDIRNLFLHSLYILYDNTEAEAIMRYYFGMKWQIPSHEFVIRPDKTFQNEEWQEMQNDLRRLQNGEPVQYVVGKSEFYGYTLRVSPLVLIPRPETEELVQMLLQTLSSHFSSNCEDAVGYGASLPCRILDFCTGSGAIAIALAKQLPHAEVWATDYRSEILELAQQNAEDNQVKVHFIQHDVLQDGAESLNGPFLAIISNPPYIPQSSKQLLHKNVKDFEPEEALFVPDENPLLFYEHIALLGRDLLTDNGMLFFETYDNYHNELESLLLQLQYQNIEKLLDLYGKPRFVTCKK